MPSLPTTAISAEAPSSITYSSETMAVVGKYTWLSVTPDSYSTWPSGSSTGSSCGSQRCHSAGGSAASRWFSSGGGGTATGAFIGLGRESGGADSSTLTPLGGGRNGGCALSNQRTRGG